MPSTSLGIIYIACTMESTWQELRIGGFSTLIVSFCSLCYSFPLPSHTYHCCISIQYNHLLGSPRSSIYFLNRSKFCLPPKQSIVGLIQPYLSLSVDLNLTFPSLVNLQSQEHEPYFWFMGILFPITTRKWKWLRKEASFLSGLT